MDGTLGNLQEVIGRVEGPAICIFEIDVLVCFGSCLPGIPDSATAVENNWLAFGVDGYAGDLTKAKIFLGPIWYFLWYIGFGFGNVLFWFFIIELENNTIF